MHIISHCFVDLSMLLALLRSKDLGSLWCMCLSTIVTDKLNYNLYNSPIHSPILIVMETWTVGICFNSVLDHIHQFNMLPWQFILLVTEVFLWHLAFLCRQGGRVQGLFQESIHVYLYFRNLFKASCECNLKLFALWLSFCM